MDTADADVGRQDPFDEHKNTIQSMLDDYTNAEIIEELAVRGLVTSRASLQRRLQAWGFRRRPGGNGVRTGASASEALVDGVKDLFHRTLLNDEQIAARLSTTLGLQTTGRQVKTIRLQARWRRRITSGQDRDALAAATFEQVNQAMTGPGRIFGRRWMITYLRQHYGFRAYREDIAAV